MTDVALCPSEIRRIAATDLSEVTAVIFDVLRATSSIITGLAHGALEILPVATLDEARNRKATEPDLLLAGERGGLPLEDFDLGNSPEEFEKTGGRRVVLTTTNGTVAIQSMRAATKVLIGSLLNIDVLANYLFRRQPKRLLIVCAGTREEFSLEDAIGAGALLARLSDHDLTDSAVLARSLYQQAEEDLEEWLCQTENGRRLQKIGKAADIHRCAQISTLNVLGELKGQAVVRLAQ